MLAMNRRIFTLSLVLGAFGATYGAPPHYDNWEVFGIQDGLPSDKVLAVYVAGDDVWFGTDKGLTWLRNGEWKTFTTADGLAHRAVVAIARDSDTGDLWIATMGGLSRYSAGRFDTFTQLDSGLANDVVYGVVVQNGEVWASTAAGVSRYEIRHKRWSIYDDSNTPMHEIWCYSVTGDGTKIYVGVWGGGLLEYNPRHDRWKDYKDPDGEFEIDLFRDDGLVHDIVTGVSLDDTGRVWIGTYFGLSSYDGRNWRNFLDHDSPLISNFIIFVATHGQFGWIGTDDGLNAINGRDWWTYRRDPETGKGIVIWQPEGGPPQRLTTESTFPHNYILGVDFQGDDIWVATEKGVARGKLSTSTKWSSLSGSKSPS